MFRESISVYEGTGRLERSETKQEKIARLFESFKGDMLARHPLNGFGLPSSEAGSVETIETVAHNESFLEIQHTLKEGLFDGVKREVNEDCFSGNFQGVFCGLREVKGRDGKLVGAHHRHGHDGDSLRVMKDKEMDRTRIVVMDGEGHGPLAGPLVEIAMAYFEFLETDKNLSDNERLVKLDEYISSLPLQASEVSVVALTITPKEGEESKKVVEWSRAGEGFVFWLEEDDSGVRRLRLLSPENGDHGSGNVLRQPVAGSLPNVGYGVLEGALMKARDEETLQSFEVSKETMVAVSTDGLFDSLREGVRLIEEIDSVYEEFLRTVEKENLDFVTFQKRFFEYMRDLHRTRESQDDTTVIWEESRS